MTENNNIITVANDDYLFVSQLLNKNVRLSNFRKVAKATISAEGQNVEVEIKPSGYDFLLKDIQVFGFCAYGNFFKDGLARDLVTVSLKNLKTDDFLVDTGVDIQSFHNNQAKFTPTIFSKDTGLRVTFKHERSVGDFTPDFPRINEDLSWYYGASVTANSPFPIKLQLVLVGAKIFPEGR